MTEEYQNLDKILPKLTNLQKNKCTKHNAVITQVCLHTECIDKNESELCQVCQIDHPTDHKLCSSLEIFSTWLLNEVSELEKSVIHNLKGSTDSKDKSLKDIDRLYCKFELEVLGLIKQSRDRLKREIHESYDNSLALLKKSIETGISESFAKDEINLKNYLKSFSSCKQNFEQYLKKVPLSDTITNAITTPSPAPPTSEMIKDHFLTTTNDALNTLMMNFHLNLQNVNVYGKKLQKEPHSINRFGQILPPDFFSWSYAMERSDAISFTSSKDLFMVGFGIFVPLGKARGTTRILQRGVALYTHDICIDNTSQNSPIWKLLLHAPVKINAEEEYTIEVNLETCRSYYGKEGKSQMQCGDGVVFEFKDSEISKNGTNVKTGQLPEIYYYIV
jgi:hypothetical protein